MEPLHEAAERWNVRPEHVLRTHGDPDHVAHEAELGLTVVTRSLDAGGLHIEALPTPGHSADHLAFVVNDELCFSGDILFKDAVGGGRDVPAIKRSVMEVLMELPPETRVLPGHTDETTIGREWEENPFVRYWRGLDDEVGEPCRVGRRRGDDRRRLTRLRRQGKAPRQVRRRPRGDRGRLTSEARLAPPEREPARRNARTFRRSRPRRTRTVEGAIRRRAARRPRRAARPSPRRRRPSPRRSAACPRPG